VTRQLARPVAIALIRRGDDLLVFDVPDAVKGVVGWRLPGGTIEFGERGSETVVREIREELGVAQGHDLVRVYSARFADERLYERDHFDCIEANGARFTCVWKPIADFRAGVPLYPDGLLELI
jgi:ADP-ribose pyrophosphatase YjhB (NUDIX family)